MNLTPLNDLCRPLASDIGTLPSWACAFPLFLGNNEELVVFLKISVAFSTFSECWASIGRSLLISSQDLQGEPCVLVSNVLPMGFLNGVGIAQHVHRNVISSAWKIGHGLPGGEAEIHKDRPYSVSPHLSKSLFGQLR